MEAFSKNLRYRRRMLAKNTGGLILSVVGFYGVISHAASQQMHEIGIRGARGALPRNILSRVLSQALLIVGLGLLLTAYAAARVVENFLVVSATDPLTYVTVSVSLAAVALLACTIPARRAMRVDHMVALRHE
jgi:putative ABC transport system permease protein